MTDLAVGTSPTDFFSADEWIETDGYLRQFLATAASYVFSGATAAAEITSGETAARNTEK
ncbi:hypothetical protein [Bauldia litoralis]|uniref:hypothetical protein n=1 Tax=Bauldia litoralis TaxID=665467 RepID=UPI003264B991